VIPQATAGDVDRSHGVTDAPSAAAAGTGAGSLAGWFRSRRPTSVRVRLLVWLSSLLSILLLISSISDYRSSLRLVLHAYDQSLSDAAVGLIAYLNVDGPEPRFEVPDATMRLLQTDERDTVSFRVIDPGGRTLGGDAAIPFHAGRTDRAFYDETVHGTPMRVFSQPISTRQGWCNIIVAETTLKRQDARRQILLSRMTIDSLVLLLTLTVVWLVVGAAMRPLDRLAAQVQARSGDDLRALPHVEVPGEAQPLVRALNRLFAQIGETQDAQRRFIENAAHQLRTPLAGLKGQLDLVVNEARGQPLSPALTERLDRVQQATNRLTHLANRLLTLARSDRTTHDSASRQRLSLPELVDDVVSAHLDAALSRRQDLGAETAAADIRAVPWELRELLANLIDNAIRYAPVGGRITVRCGVQGGVGGVRPFLEVEDDGPGVAPSERQKVFERFYRVPGSPAGGSGLGLAIVREIAALYGGQVQITDPPAARGLCVRVTFPPA
jgi:two-component system sensor histidine kinase TctE